MELNTSIYARRGGIAAAAQYGNFICAGV